MRQPPQQPQDAAPAATTSASCTMRQLWTMLLALLSGFALSQAFRTITAILAQGLQADFGISAQSLGAFAGLFGLSFGIAQLMMGIGMDVYGLRRTVLMASPLSIAGAALSALAPSYTWLMLGQILIGVGCSPAFLACTVFIARHFPGPRFAFFSGVSMGVGGLGLLFTGTPLAWIVQQFDWRMGFWVLMGLCMVSWMLIFALVHEPASPHTPTLAKENWWQALQRFSALFALPHTWGIVLLGMSCYAAFLSLRGLWLGPILMDRFHFSLVDSGNVALLVSIISLFTPAMFGRMDPGPARRRRWISGASLLMATLFLCMAFLQYAFANVALIIAMGLLSGYTILQYADVRSSYPPELTARALSVFTMAMFLGVALMQWFTGTVAAWAQTQQIEPYRAVMLTIALWLATASFAFRWLPKSPLLDSACK